MKVYLIAFGKIRTPGLRQTTDYYLKLLSGFTKVEEIELKPLTVSDKSEASRMQIQEKEAEIFLESVNRKISPRGKLFLLDETGESLPTRDWAKKIQNLENDSTPEIALGIGSSLGFSKKVKEISTGQFSLGPQTLSHELARAVLCEQLYRAWGVNRGHPYHVEGE